MTSKEVVGLAFFSCHQPKAEDDYPEPTQKSERIKHTMDYASDGGDAIKILDYLAERETFYPVQIHTANPVGRANMERTINRYWK